jgi:hypothetical protein
LGTAPNRARKLKHATASRNPALTHLEPRFSRFSPIWNVSEDPDGPDIARLQKPAAGIAILIATAALGTRSAK